MLQVGLTYLITVTVVYFIARRFEEDAADMSQGVGTIVAVSLAARLHGARSRTRAPAKEKLAVGATLAVLCVVQGLAFQRWLGWMEHLDISLLFGVLGALALSFVFWNIFEKSFRRAARGDYARGQDVSKPPIPKP